MLGKKLHFILGVIYLTIFITLIIFGNSIEHQSNYITGKLIQSTQELRAQYDKNITIKILNPQSYPKVGKTWSVNFTTTGKEDLIISAINGTTYNKDISFVSLTCDNKKIYPARFDNYIVAEDWKCYSTASLTMQVMTSGKHHQKFVIGNKTTYANNYAVGADGLIKESNVCITYKKNHPNKTKICIRNICKKNKLNNNVHEKFSKNSLFKYRNEFIKIRSVTDERCNITNKNTNNINYLPLFNHTTTDYNTCTPKLNNDLIITSKQNCKNKIITVNTLNITGTITLNNITISSENINVLHGATLHIKDSPHTIWVNGNWTISGKVIISNTSVRFNGTTNGASGMNVTPQGWLIINESSNITNGLTSDAYYYFIVDAGSNFTMDNSFMSNAGWGYSQNTQGLEIRTTVDSFNRNYISNNFYGISIRSNNSIYKNLLINNSRSVDINIQKVTKNNTFDNVSIIQDKNLISVSSYSYLINYSFYNLTINSSGDEQIDCELIDTKFIDCIFEGKNRSLDTTSLFAWSALRSTFKNSIFRYVSTALYGQPFERCIFENVSVYGSTRGIILDGESHNNTIFDSKFTNNTQAIYLFINGLTYPKDNYIYNNYFNNSINIKIDENIGGKNYFNTTLDCSKTNIVGGICVGGNYYANRTTNAFSQTCTDDVAPWGICDDTYNMTTGTSIAYDYLPLTDAHQLAIEVIWPSENINVLTNQFFNVTLNVTCIYGDCGVVNVTLDPIPTNIVSIDLKKPNKINKYPYLLIIILSTLLLLSIFSNKKFAFAIFILLLLVGCIDILSVTQQTRVAQNTNFTATVHTNITETDTSQQSYVAVLIRNSWNVTGANYTGPNKGDLFRTNVPDDPYTAPDGYKWWKGATATFDVTEGDRYNYTYKLETEDESGIFDVVYYVGYNDSGSTNWQDSYSAKISVIKGTISTIDGDTPFYTNKSDNPYNITLGLGESKVVTFWVNATGTIDTTYEFFATAEINGSPETKVKSKYFNITIHRYPRNTTCNSCTNCSKEIANSYAGEYVYLTQNITMETTSTRCINLSKGVVFDCNGSHIIGTGITAHGTTYGIYIDEDNGVFQNCRPIRNFTYNIYVEPAVNDYIKNIKLKNITTASSKYGLYADSSENMTINDLLVKNTTSGIDATCINSTITNITLINSTSDGLNINYNSNNNYFNRIYAYNSTIIVNGNNNTLKDLSVFNVDDDCLAIDGPNITIINASIKHCEDYGVDITSQANLTLKNISITKNYLKQGFFIEPYSTTYAELSSYSVENISINNILMHFYNQKKNTCPDNQMINLSGSKYIDNISNMFFIGCDNVTVTDGNFDIDNLNVFYTNNSLFKNIRFNSTYENFVLAYSHNITIDTLVINKTYSSVEIRDSPNIIFKNIIIKNSILSALDLSYEENITIDNCTIKNSASYGISNTYSTNTTIKNVTIINVTRGITMATCQDLKYINLKITNASTRCISNRVDNSIFANISCVKSAIGIYQNDGPTNNIFTNISFSEVNYSLYLGTTSNNNTYINTNFSGSYLSDIYLYGGNNNTLLNSTFSNITLESCSSTACRLYVKYYAYVQVNYTNGSVVPYAEIMGYNSTGSLFASSTANASGRTNIDLLSYQIYSTSTSKNSGTYHYHSNHTIYAEKEEKYGSSTINLTKSKYVEVLLNKTSLKIILKNPKNESYERAVKPKLNFTVSLPATINVYARYDDEVDSSEYIWNKILVAFHLNNDSSYGEDKDKFYDFNTGKYNGTCDYSGGACPAFVEHAKLKGAYDFDGTDDGIYFLLHSNQHTNFTYSLWFRSDDAGSIGNSYVAQRFVTEPRTTSYSKLGFGINNDHVAVYWYDGSSNTQEGTTTLQADTWYHTTLTYDQTSIKMYLNGKLEGEWAESNMNAGGAYNIWIGKQHTSARYFDGTIDEFIMWNRSLSDQEVYSLYDRTRLKHIYYNKNSSGNLTYNLSSFPLSAQPNMLILLHFDNDSSVGENDTHIYDWSNNGNNATSYVNNSDSSWRGANSTGKFGRAYKFIKDDHISLPTADFHAIRNATISLWVKFRQTSPYALGVWSFKENAADNYDYMLIDGNDNGNGRIRFEMRHSSGITYSIKSDNSASVGKWYKVDAVCGDGGMKLYVNGIKQSQTNTTTFCFDNISSGTLYHDIGVLRYGGNKHYFNGSIDDFAIWNRSLTDLEIQQNYHVQAGRYHWYGNATNATKSSQAGIIWFDLDTTKIKLVTPANRSSQNGSFVTLRSNVSKYMDARLYAYRMDEIDSSETDIWNKLVLLYHFNNDSTVGENNTLIFDWSGAGNNATCEKNNCSNITTIGKFKNARNFDGKKDFFRIPDSPSLRLQNFTISAWIYKQTNTGTADIIIAKQYTGGNPYSNSYTLFQQGKEYKFYYYANGQNKFLNSSINLTENRWSHVAVTYNSTMINLYLNGKLVKNRTETYPLVYDTSPVLIGADDDSLTETYDHFFNGSIDEVVIWNRSLSAHEIMELYDKGRPKQVLSEDYTSSTLAKHLDSFPLSVQKGMVLLMHFDNDSSVSENNTYIYDWTGLGNNGTSYVNNSDGSWKGTVAKGKFGRAYEFNKDDYISIPTDNLHTIRNATISLWIKFYKSFPNAYGAWTFKQDPATDSDYILIDGNNDGSGKIRFEMKDSTGTRLYSIKSNKAASLDKWYKLDVTCGDSGMKMYVNGIKQTQTNDTTFCFDNITSGTLFNEIGRLRYSGATYYFNGSIDEFAIWNRSLSATEIANLYELQSGRYYWYGNVTDPDEKAITEQTNTWWFDFTPGPRITNLTATPAYNGFGKKTKIRANVTPRTNPVDSCWIEITRPNSTKTNYTMTNISFDMWEYNFTGWQNGTYSYKIFANDTSNIKTYSSNSTFNLFVNLTIQIRTIRDSYHAGEIVNITDPPTAIDVSTSNRIYSTSTTDTYLGVGQSTGDFNGDGAKDIALGAMYSSIHQTDEGAVYIVFGNDSISDGSYTISSDYDILIYGDLDSGYLGRAVVTGDVNGDGITDLIASEPNAGHNSRPSSGSVYVFFGNTLHAGIYNASVNYSMRFDGGTTDGSCGMDLYTSDINGDNIDDIIIGCYTSEPYGRTEAGSAYVILGNSSFVDGTYDLDNSNNYFVKYEGVSPGRLGREVLAGDINNDGNMDLILSAYRTDYGTTTAGSAYVIFGPISSGTKDLTYASNYNLRYDGIYDQDMTGLGLGVADLNNDSKTDLLLGSWAQGSSRTGAIYVILGNRTFTDGNISLSDTSKYDVKIIGVSNEFTGYNLDTIDYNNDGIDDMIVGSLYSDQNSRTDSGSVYLVYGKQSLFTGVKTKDLADVSEKRFDGEAASDLLGSFVFAGDVNNDSVKDLLMGADGVAKVYIKFRPKIKYKKYSSYPRTTDLEDFKETDTRINLTLQNSYGKIVWLKNASLNYTYDIDNNTILSNSKIFVNTTRYPNLNKPANITINNINLGYPAIYKDGTFCSDCNILSWNTNAGRLIFNVSGFSEYTWEEANQSKLQNNGTTNASVWILLQVQKWNSANWDEHWTIHNETHDIDINTLIKFDQYFNDKWNTTANGTGDGDYRVYAAATDDNGNVLENMYGVWLNITYNFTIETSPVSLELYDPENYGLFTSAPIKFNWTASDADDPTIICDFYLDGDLYEQDITAASGATFNYTLTTLSEGLHTWHVECFDDAMNTNISQVRHLWIGYAQINCTNITYSGDYILVSDANTTATCINIKTDNVNLNCKSHILRGTQNGYGINISSQKNITIRNCTITNFTRAVSIEKTNHSIFTNMTLTRNNGDYAGFYANYSYYNNITNIYFTNNNATDNAGLYLQHSSNFRVINTSYINNNISKDTSMYGGGVVGMYHYSQMNVFEQINIKNTKINMSDQSGFIYGGSVIGSYYYSSYANMSNININNTDIYSSYRCYGSCTFGTYFSHYNNFINIEIATTKLIVSDNIYGAGIVNAEFKSNNKNITLFNSNLSFNTAYGGGCCGLYSTSLANFSNVNVNVAEVNGKISGGGIIGTYSSTDSNINNFNIRIARLNISILSGGGVLGLSYNSKNSDFKNINISNSKLLIHTYFKGGGVVGLDTGNLQNTFTNIQLINNLVQSSTSVSGGALFGGYSSDYNRINNTNIINNTINITGSGGAGCILGFHYSDDNNITFANIFNNTIYETYNLGGGFVGLSNSNNNNISKMIIKNNLLKATGNLVGGSIGLYSSEKNHISKFTLSNNSIITTDDIIGGAIGISYCDNSIIKSISIAKQNTSGDYVYGGIIGVNSDNNGLIQNITINKSIVKANIFYGGSTIGLVTATNTSIDSIKIINISVHYDGDFGNIGLSRTSKNNRINNIDIDGSKSFLVYLHNTNTFYSLANNSFTNLSIKNTLKSAINLDFTRLKNTTFKNIIITNTTLAAINITNATDTNLINITFINTSWDIYAYTPDNNAIGKYEMDNFSLTWANEYGKIVFTNTTLKANGANLSKVISLTSNSAFVNSSLDNSFNQSANITFTGITYTTPTIKVSYNDNGDSTICPDTVCTQISFSGTTFKFNVTHFTTYFLTGMCSPSLNTDWIITNTQTCDNVDVTTGTGKIIVNAGGKLYLINSANVSSTGLDVTGSIGDSVFVNRDCHLNIN